MNSNYVVVNVRVKPDVNLTRLFAVAQFYHFAFMIVSLALLGFGASGTLLALLPRLRARDPAVGAESLIRLRIVVDRIDL